jgi:hypothetical protein
VPHFLQNLAPGLASVLQVGQTSSSFVPQPSQNAASTELSLLHLVQSIDQVPSSSSKALASFRSAVSKPSVNQQ